MAARKRRHAVRHAERELARRRLRMLAARGAAVLAIAAVAIAFAQGLIPLPEHDFPIRTLKVESTFERVGRAEVQAVVAPRAAGFFETDVRAVREALVALPWVASASVRRVWPDTLHVVLVEERPVARWAQGGLVNIDGGVFEPGAGEEPPGLPLFEGPPRSAPQVLAYYRRLQGELAPLGLTVQRVGLDARRAWELTLDNGIDLTLGRKDPDGRLRRFVQLYPGTIAARADEIDQVDLRYSNGFAVRWRAPGASAHADARGDKTGDAV